MVRSPLLCWCYVLSWRNDRVEVVAQGLGPSLGSGFWQWSIRTTATEAKAVFWNGRPPRPDAVGNGFATSDLLRLAVLHDDMSSDALPSHT